jgi:hypothetical protein
VTGDEAQGWFDDPFRLHEARYFSAGRPTKLVRDGTAESYDEPPHEGAGDALRTAEATDTDLLDDDMPVVMPRRSHRAGLITIATVAVVAGVVIATVVANKPGPVTTPITATPMSPGAFVAQSVHHTLAQRTADITVSGSMSDYGANIPISGTGQIDFATNAVTASFTFRNASHHTLVWNVIETAKNSYLSLGGDGASATKWFEGSVQQSGPADEGDSTFAAFLATLAQRDATVLPLGTKIIDGVTCTGYSVTQGGQSKPTTIAYTDSTPKSTPQVITTVWFDAHGLLRQVSMPSVVQPIPGGVNDSPSVALIMDLSNYGTPVRVTPPPPSDTISSGTMFSGS